MFVVFVLESELTGRYYIGHTANIDQRLKDHTGGKVRSTKGYRPWKVILTEQYATKNEAFKRAREIKSYKSGEAFSKLIFRSMK